MKEPEITSKFDNDDEKSRLIEHLQSELARKDEEIEAWQGMYIEAENKARGVEEDDRLAKQNFEAKRRALSGFTL